MFERLTEELAFIGIHDVVIPIVLFFVSLGLGLITEKIGIAYFHKLAQRTEFEGDDRIVESLKGMPTLWGVLVGVAVVFQTTTIPEKYVGTINKALIVIAIFSVTRIVEKIVSTFMDHLGQKTGHAVPSTSIFNNIIKLSIYILGALMALHVLGISITPLITALGIGGLAVALALQSTLANLFAGIQIILSKQVSIGDYIRIGALEEGYVTDITWRNTTITAMQNNVIIVPNSNMSTLNIVNYGRELKDLSFPVSVGVSYDCDLDHVESVLVALVLQMQQDFPDKMPEFEPTLRFGAFADSSINVTIHLRTKEYGFQFALRSEFVKRIHKRFKQENIEIPFPIRTLYVKPNSQSKEIV
jgi:small-conductance mechanosensitive channel